MEVDNYLTNKIEVRDSIIKFKNDIDVQKLQSLYFSKSFSEIFSVSRREISHSAFIAWLLDNKESHSLSFFPIQKFMEIVLFRTENDIENKHPLFYNSFLTDSYSVKGVKVEKEKGLGTYGRLDIYVEVIFLIDKEEYTTRLIIENKVESKESDCQTQRYFDYFDKLKKKNDINLYIYLSAISTLELKDLKENQCNCKEFIHINYQYLVDYILEPALNQNISDRTIFIIKEYLQSLSQPSLDEESTNHKQSLIMALGKEEKELLSIFWNKNEKLIISAMYAISTDESQDEVDRESVKGALDAYTMKKGIGAYVQRNLRELFTNNMIDSDEVSKMQTLEYSKNTFDIQFPLLIKANGIPNIRYWKNGILIQGTEYFICSQWYEQQNNNDRIYFDKWLNSKINS